MNTPMIIPMIIPNQETPKCPSCGKDEAVVPTCSWCGYVYEGDEPGIFVKIVMVIGVIVCLALAILLLIIALMVCVEWTVRGTPLSEAIANTLRGAWEILTNL